MAKQILSVAPHRVVTALGRRLRAAKPPPPLQVLLMVGLGGPEDGCTLHLGDDRFAGRQALCLTGGKGFRLRKLVLRVAEDPVPVLRAEVIAHLVALGWIDGPKERLAELGERDLLLIVNELACLGVARSASADLLVRGPSGAPLGVPDARCDDPGQPLVAQLCTPKAATSERGHAVLPVGAALRNCARKCPRARIAPERMRKASQRGVRILFTGDRCGERADTFEWRGKRGAAAMQEESGANEHASTMAATFSGVDGAVNSWRHDAAATQEPIGVEEGRGPTGKLSWGSLRKSSARR